MKSTGAFGPWRLVLLLAVLVLAGCKASADIEIAEDGAGRLRAVLEMTHKEQADLAKHFGSNFCRQIRLPAGLVISRVEKDDNGVRCVFERRFAHLREVADEGIRVSQLEDGEWQLALDLAFLLGRKMRFEGMSGGVIVLASLFAQHKQGFPDPELCVRAPHVVSGTGIVSPDRRRLCRGVNIAGLWRGRGEIVFFTQSKTLIAGEGHQGLVSGIALSADGRRLYSVSWDETIRAWDIAGRGKQLRVAGIGMRGMASAAWGMGIARLAGGRLAVHTRRGEVIVFREHDVKPVEKLTAVVAMAASPDGRLLALGRKGAVVDIVEVRDGELKQANVLRSITLEGEREGEMALAFSADGEKIAVALGRNGFAICGVRGGRCETSLPIESPVVSVAFSHDGRRLAVVERTRTHMWDVGHRKVLWSLRRSSSLLRMAPAFSPDDRFVLVQTSRVPAALVRVADGRPVKLLTSGTRGEIASVLFSPDGKRFFLGNGDGQVSMRHMPSARPLGVLGWGEVDAFAHSADGGRLAVAFSDGRVRLFEAVSGRLLRRFSIPHVRSIEETNDRDVSHLVVPGQMVFPAQVQLTADGRRLLAYRVEGDRLWLLDVENAEGRVLRVPGMVFAALSPDGKLLALALRDHRLVIVNAVNNALVRQMTLPPGVLPKTASMHFSPEGRWLVLRNAERFILVDMKKGGVRFLPNDSELRMTIAVHPNGKVAAVQERTAEADVAIALHDIGSGRVIARAQLKKKGQPMEGLAFSPDGTRLLAWRGEETWLLAVEKGGTTLRQVKIKSYPYYQSGPLFFLQNKDHVLNLEDGRYMNALKLMSIVDDERHFEVRVRLGAR